jgi:hypothetical protein
MSAPFPGYPWISGQIAMTETAGGLPHPSGAHWTPKIRRELGCLNWVPRRYYYCLDYKVNVIYDFESKTKIFKNYWEGRKINGGHIITECWAEYFDLRVYVYGLCSGFVICTVCQLSRVIKSRMVKWAGHAKERSVQYLTRSIWREETKLKTWT